MPRTKTSTPSSPSPEKPPTTSSATPPEAPPKTPPKTQTLPEIAIAVIRTLKMFNDLTMGVAAAPAVQDLTISDPGGWAGGDLSHLGALVRSELFRDADGNPSNHLNFGFLAGVFELDHSALVHQDPLSIATLLCRMAVPFAIMRRGAARFNMTKDD